MTRKGSRVLKKPLRTNRTTGVLGVCRITFTHKRKDGKRQYVDKFRATWRLNRKGKPIQKDFPVATHGVMAARRLAIAQRKAWEHAR